MKIQENQMKHKLVGQVQASDRDEPPNNDFYFQLAATNQRDLEKFEINKKSGEIRTLKQLDHEDKAVYTLRAKAIDKRRPELYSETMISIFIGDTNDNKPEWKFPNKDNDTITISNKARVKDNIARINARDIDRDNKVTYDIQGGNEDQFFDLNSATGMLTVKSDLTVLKGVSEITLELTAKDSGNPPNSAFTKLYIVVNESIPYPAKQTFTSHILSGTNFTIVVSLTCACLLLCIILIAVILLIRRKERKKRVHKYNCRMEALKMLTAKESGQCGGGGGSLDRSPIQTKGHLCYEDPYTDCCTADSLKNNTGCKNSIGNSTMDSTGSNTWSGPEKLHKVKVRPYFKKIIPRSKFFSAKQ